MVGTKAVPQTPQGPRGLACVFYEHSTKYTSSATNTVKLYHHIPGSGCPFDIWQQTWERHERIQRRNATERNTLFTSYNNPIDIRIIVSSYCSDLAHWFCSSNASFGATKRGLRVPGPNSRGHAGRKVGALGRGEAPHGSA